MIEKTEPSRPAHRPSRREEIIDAAIRVFSREGYTAASVEDIAQECGVAPTAVYYHFGGKDELFNQALRTALDRFSEAVYAARLSGDPTAPATLRRVIHAGWLRATSHPAEMRFLLQHTFRPTPEARKLQQDWEERHVQRSLDYLPPPAAPPRTPRDARVQHAARLLASRVMVYTTIVAQESRLAGGPLAEQPVTQVAKAVEDVCIRIVTGTAHTEPGPEGVTEEPPAPKRTARTTSKPATTTTAKPATTTTAKPAKKTASKAAKKTASKAAKTSPARRTRRPEE